jgi:hypothetical protein
MAQNAARVQVFYDQVLDKMMVIVGTEIVFEDYIENFSDLDLVDILDAAGVDVEHDDQMDLTDEDDF